MAQRSTRNKMRWQLKKCIDDCQSITMHLKYLDDLAEGQSKVVNETIPMLSVFIDALQSTLEKFRSEL